MFVYVEDLKESTTNKQLLELISEFKKMAEYKTKTHKNAYISNNKRADTKIKNTIPFIIIQQK